MKFFVGLVGIVILLSSMGLGAMLPENEEFEEAEGKVITRENSHYILIVKKESEEQDVIEYETYFAADDDWSAICEYHENKRLTEKYYRENHPYNLETFNCERFHKIISCQKGTTNIAATVFVDKQTWRFQGLAFDTGKFDLSNFFDSCREILEAKHRNKKFEHVMVLVGRHAIKYQARLREIGSPQHYGHQPSENDSEGCAFIVSKNKQQDSNESFEFYY